jgi:hypothetical protein
MASAPLSFGGCCMRFIENHLTGLRRRTRAVLAVAGLLAAVPAVASAADTLVIADASVVKYVVDSSGLVYLRNLDAVDASWAGCCHYFWMNVNTEAGKAQFSAFLTARATRSRLVIYAASKSGSPNEALYHVGDF